MAAPEATEDLVEIQFEDDDGDTLNAWVPRSFGIEIQESAKTDPTRHQFYRDQIMAQVNYDRMKTKTQSNVTTKETTKTKDTIHVWTEKEEKCLIHLRLDMDNAFNGSKSHDQLWGKILQQMTIELQPMNVTKVQITNKWKNLKKKYKEVLDANKKTGNSPTHWKYFDTFNCAYGNKASTTPVFSIDTSKKTPITRSPPLASSSSSRSCPGSSKSHTLDATDGASSCQSNSNKRKRGAGAKDKDQEPSKQDILNGMAAQHKDKMSRMDKILNVFKVLAGQKPDTEESDSDN